MFAGADILPRCLAGNACSLIFDEHFLVLLLRRYLLLQRRVKQFTTDFKATTGKQPSLDDVATALGQSRFDIQKVMAMQFYPQLLGTRKRCSSSNISNDHLLSKARLSSLKTIATTGTGPWKIYYHPCIRLL